MAKKRHIKKLLNTLKILKENGNVVPVVEKYFRQRVNGRFSNSYWDFMGYLNSLEKEGYFTRVNEYTPKLTPKSEKLLEKCS